MYKYLPSETGHLGTHDHEYGLSIIYAYDSLEIDQGILYHF